METWSVSSTRSAEDPSVRERRTLTHALNERMIQAVSEMLLSCILPSRHSLNIWNMAALCLRIPAEDSLVLRPDNMAEHP